MTLKIKELWQAKWIPGPWVDVRAGNATFHIARADRRRLSFIVARIICARSLGHGWTIEEVWDIGQRLRIFHPVQSLKFVFKPNREIITRQ